jgi:hypothetical protein
MKKIYSILFLLSFTVAGFSQNTCAAPYRIYSPTAYNYTAITGSPNPDTTNNYGCLASTANTTWLYFQTCSSGNTIVTLTSYGSSSSDLGFICWGPLSTPADSNLSAAQVVDCGYTLGTGFPAYITIPSALTGDLYKIMITNYNNYSGTTFTIGGVTSPGTYDSICPACSAPIPPQQICQVTTDPVLNKNIIIWEKDSTYMYDYMIQRETTTAGVYATLGTVINSDSSAYVDSVSNPMIQSFRYRIVTNDSCGNLNSAVQYHETIHLLTSTSSSTGYPQLAWNDYIGFSYGTFFIYRGSSPATLALYDSISASFNSYTDVAAVTGMNYYAVVVMPPSPCQPSRSMSTGSMSNVAPVMFTGINEYEFNGLTVGPNPANSTLNFTLGTTADVHIGLIDITGRIILSKEFKNVSSEMIDLSEIANGSYVVSFSSGNRTAHRNIIVAK